MPRPETKSPPVRAAWRKGFSAGKRGLAEASNPYLTKNSAERIEDIHGWSRIYAQTWLEGWKDGQMTVEATVRCTCPDAPYGCLLHPLDSEVECLGDGQVCEPERDYRCPNHWMLS